jgi:hypothetical protein
MKNVLLKVGSFMLVVIMLHACSKKDEQVAAPTKTQLLAKNWKLTAMTIAPAVLGQTNLLPSFPTCEIDDIVKFNANGTYSLDEGLTKCSPSDPQVYETGTWRLLNNDTQIEQKATGSSVADIGNVVSITATEFVVSTQEVSAGITYTITFRYIPN